MSSPEFASSESDSTAPLPPARRAESPRAESPRGLLVGYQVGRYRLIERLGGGVMAAVYRAAELDTDAPVAVKVLLPDADPVIRERFREEARTHGRLRHPNIVSILDEGQEPYSGITYLVMALVDGPGLNELIEERERLSLSDAARILAPVARALGYAHRNGIIHRDVKPSNVLLQPAPSPTEGAPMIEALGRPVVPLLSDFGIARALDSPELTGIGRTIGTPTYMSPEQCADSHDLDGRSDLYSLGAVFYRCLVGRPPFSGSTTQILHAHVYEPLLIPETVLATLPGAAVDVLRRSLAKDPGLRFVSGDEMADALDHLLGLPKPETDLLPVDDTATMPALQAVRTTTPMQVLVPAPQPRPAPPTPESVQLLESEPLVRDGSHDAAVVPALPGAPPKARAPRRWVGALLGAGLSALVIVAAVWAVLNLLPGELLGGQADSNAIADAGDVADTGSTAQDTGSAAVASPLPLAGPGDATREGSTNDIVAAPDSATTDAAPPAGTPATVTPAPLPTPAGNIEDFWEDAETAFIDEEWQIALDFYTLVQRINPAYELDAIESRLFDVHVGLAAEELRAGRLDRAKKQLDEALALQPDAEPLLRVQRALEQYAVADSANNLTARRELWGTLINYGEQLAQVGSYCGAVAQLTAAMAILPEGAADSRLADYQLQCDRARGVAETARALENAAGRIVYSTQEGDRYAIYSAAAEVDSGSSLLIGDGAQPGAQRTGPLIAFRSTREGEPGIALFDLTSAGNPGDRSSRVTEAPGDAHDAPPSWATDGSRFVYSSTPDEGQQPTRLFIHNLESDTENDLGVGKDPVWEPAGERIIYNGTNETGGEPGLYLMDAGGENRQRLTINGNDQRPVWSPDGNNVVFMSTRSGNWDVYRLSVRDGTFVQLTDDPAQDGLPSISPDGKLVIFASDRGGVWRLYVVPIDGGAELPLLTVNGVLTNWLEHSIQWTR